MQLIDSVNVFEKNKYQLLVYALRMADESNDGALQNYTRGIDGKVDTCMK